MQKPRQYCVLSRRPTQVCFITDLRSTNSVQMTHTLWSRMVRKLLTADVEAFISMVLEAVSGLELNAMLRRFHLQGLV